MTRDRSLRAARARRVSPLPWARPASLALAALAVASAASARAQGVVQRVSTLASGAQSSGPCGTGPYHAIATDALGRFVVFIAGASDLVAGDTNGVPDVFLKDTGSGAVELVSIGLGGASADGTSRVPSMSPDGRYVVFESVATNLVPGDTNGASDVFLRDRVSGVTERVSLTVQGAQGNGNSEGGRCSADGRFVVFWSAATNLVSGDTNATGDVFLRDRLLARTKRLSMSVAGGQANDLSGTATISADGQYVAFETLATNLALGDTNGTWDLFLADTVAGTLQRIGPASGVWNGASKDPWITPTGSAVAFVCQATDAVLPDANGAAGDVLVWSRTSGLVERASASSAGVQADAECKLPRLSSDGRKVAFESFATNLVAGDTNATSDVFVRDLDAGTTQRASVASSGGQGNGLSFYGVLSGDARKVAFGSFASNLVAGDTNFQADVFLHDRSYAFAQVYCTAKTNSQGCTSAIAAAGTCSATNQLPFKVTASLLLNQQFAILFYSKVGAASSPFQGGFLCVQPPTHRSSVLSTAGSPPPQIDCSGVLSFDFNLWILAGNDPGLVPGAPVWGQFWSRDPFLPPPFTTNLTDAVAFAVGP